LKNDQTNFQDFQGLSGDVETLVCGHNNDHDGETTTLAIQYEGNKKEISRISRGKVSK